MKKVFSADEIFILANEEWEKDNLHRAVQWLRKGTALRHADSINSLGYFYEHGIGVSTSISMATSLYRKAALMGDMCGIANLGLTYLNEGNIRGALRWLERAASMGEEDSAIVLARLVSSRRFGDRLRGKAFEYLSRAVELQLFEKSQETEAKELLSQLSKSKSGTSPT